MRVGFDLRPCLREETGVGVYYRNLLEGLAALAPGLEAFLVSASWKDRFPPDRLPPFASRRFRDLRVPVRIVNRLWGGWGVPTLDAVFGARLDLTHSATPLILPTRGKTVVTVHDLFFLEDPARADREAARDFRRRVGPSLRKADGIAANSEFTRDSVVRTLGIDPAKIRVTRLGVAAAFRTPPPEERVAAVRRDRRLPGRFALFVGALEKRKNLPGLLEALARLRAGGLRVPLVVAGREGEDSAAVRRSVDRLGLGDDVLFLGYVRDDEVPALYRAAALLVVPSFHEGFGLSLAEAMAAGVPAAVSRAGALPEVGGDAAAYFAPGDVAGMAETIAAVLSDERRRGTMIARGRERSAAFDWRRTAAETLALYRSLVGDR